MSSISCSCPELLRLFQFFQEGAGVGVAEVATLPEIGGGAVPGAALAVNKAAGQIVGPILRVQLDNPVEVRQRQIGLPSLQVEEAAAHVRAGKSRVDLYRPPQIFERPVGVP